MLGAPLDTSTNAAADDAVSQYLRAGSADENQKSLLWELACILYYSGCRLTADELYHGALCVLRWHGAVDADDAAKRMAQLFRLIHMALLRHDNSHESCRSSICLNVPSAHGCP